MSKKLAIVAMVVLLAAMGGVVAYYFMQQGAESGEQSAEQAVEAGANPAMMEKAEDPAAQAPGAPGAGEEGALVLKDESLPEAETPPAEAQPAEVADTAQDTQPAGQEQAAADSGLPQPEPVVGGAAAPTAGKFALQPPKGAVQVAQAPSSGDISPGTDKAPAPPVSKPKPATGTEAVKTARSVVKTAALKAGNRLERIEVQQAGEAVTVRLVAARSVESFKHFSLKSPSRLVVDLPGAWQAAKNPAVPKNGMVKAIRIGRHADKLRLVLDLTAAVKVGGTVEKEADTQLVVTVR